jgi:hypothetical protein
LEVGKTQEKCMNGTRTARLDGQFTAVRDGQDALAGEVAR